MGWLILVGIIVLVIWFRRQSQPRHHGQSDHGHSGHRRHASSNHHGGHGGCH